MSAEPLRVLLVEDEPGHAELARRAFEGQAGAFDVSVAETVDQARAALHGQTPPDLVIADWLLPDGEGLDEGLHGHLPDERPLPGPDLHQPEALQRPQRLPHRRPAHHELLGEVALGGQLVAALEASLGDHQLHLPDDLLVDAGGLDRLHVWPVHGLPPVVPALKHTAGPRSPSPGGSTRRTRRPRRARSSGGTPTAGSFASPHARRC